MQERERKKKSPERKRNMVAHCQIRGSHIFLNQHCYMITITTIKIYTLLNWLIYVISFYLKCAKSTPYTILHTLTWLLLFSNDMNVKMKRNGVNAMTFRRKYNVWSYSLSQKGCLFTGLGKTFSTNIQEIYFL